MKRRNYDIDGDTVSNKLVVPRYGSMIYWEDVSQPPILCESFFSWLPEEVIGVIASHTLLHDTSDFQVFLRYLLPMFGISLSVLRATYTSIQETMLGMMQDLLATDSPRLFRECLRERLRRISVCVASSPGNFTQNVEQLTSVQIISTISYAELFAFVCSRVCECCKEKFAIARSMPLDITLCEDCGTHLNYDERVRDSKKALDWTIKCAHDRLYCWASEKLVRLWLGLSKDNPYTPPIFRSQIMGRKSYTFYLLKDVLPFVDSQFLVQPKPSCITIK
jgi:hypothetical protein